MNPAKFIVDLYELRARHNQPMMKRLPLDGSMDFEFVENTRMYAYYNMLIAFFLDKYHVNHRDIEEEIYNRDVEKRSTGG